MGKYPSLCVRSMHAVRTHCKNLVSAPKVPEPDQAATSACAKKGPKPGEHFQLFRMKWDRSKGFYPEKCSVEAIALFFEWRGYLVPQVVLQCFTILSRIRTVCPTNTSVRTVFFEDLIVRWTRGGGQRKLPESSHYTL